MACLVLFLLVAIGVGLGVLMRPTRAPTPRSVPVTGRAQAEERLVFELADPAGDDRGPGSYRYPSDPSFVPGTFDLRRFRVTADAQAVHFRLSFGAVPNPWGAPEGFGYQRVDVYLDTVPGKGSSTPARSGVNVRFEPRFGWEYLVRCAPWRGSRVERLVNAADGLGGTEVVPAQVTAVRDGEDAIRVSVPRSAIGEPSRRWRYYVLVGGYDAFGPDEYRPVTARGGRWVFSGGCDSNTDPNVLDVLAPRFGLHPQHRQLRCATPGGQAVVYPVGR